MLGHLIRIDSVDASGADYPLLLSSVDAPELCHLDGAAWEPNIARLPVLRYDFFGGDFRGQIGTPSAGFSVATDGITDFATRIYADARIRFWRGEVGDDWSAFELLFDGLITGEPQIGNGIATFTARANDAWLDTPLLDIYAGTGGIEGEADMTGLAKPLTFGNVCFADAVLIDPVDLVYQVHDGAVNGIVAAYDRVASLGASVGDYADLAALLAASVANGRWATCKALGLVRLGAPPDGRVAFDVQGGGSYARKPGAIIAAIADIAGGTVDAANLAALDTARPYNLQLQITGQTTARAVIQSIADSVCAVAGVTWLGDLFVQPVAIGEPTETLAADGTSPLAVADISQLPIAAPYWRLATEAERSFVVYAQSEVASGSNWRGTYESARVYRLDDAVFASDGRAFSYVNATPSAGNAPPALPSTSNSYWQLIGAATVGVGAGLSAIGSSPPVIIGNTATKESGGDAYNSAAAGEPYANSCFAEANRNGSDSVRLSLGPSASSTAFDEHYFAELTSSSGWTIRVAGSIVAGGTAASSGVLRFAYTGSSLTVEVDGVLVGTYTTGISAGQTLYPKVLLFREGSSYTGIRYGYFQDRTWSAIGGSGKPEDNATVGAPSGTTVAGRDALDLADKVDGIEDGATVGAPSGTNVAGRAATEVASTIAAGGGVATNQVSTTSIVANAVSDTGFAHTAGGILLPNTGLIDLQTLVVVADGVTPVNLGFGFAYYWDNDNARGEFALYRDTTSLVAFDPLTVNNNENPLVSSEWSDFPAAGTYTYRLKGQANDHLQIGAKNRYIRQLELKR